MKSIVYLSLLISSFMVYAIPPQSESAKLSKDAATIAIAIHGGAGTILKENIRDEQEQAIKSALKQALELGYKELKAGKDGSSAVIAALVYLENSPLFNAGVGAVYTYDEQHELDASIMHGKDKQAGAIAGVRNIKNPIKGALLVMNESPHVMLTGEGAEAFAAKHDLESVENSFFNTEFRKKALDRAKSKIDELSFSEQNGQSTEATLSDLLPFQDDKYGTVGAVVLDAHGNLVAGTSTGGMTAKRYGRVGDSPIIGAGTFADNHSCAVSATGHGEYFIRHNVAADICARVKYKGDSIQEAANAVIFETLNANAGSGGVIAIDSLGNISMPFNTPGMYRASIDTAGNMTIKIYKD
ncbi:isoaspartyl peptidase/L-asparaginase family protein [Glaciecola petra]|uniref:Isoaspartyl peptidase/L-asparaginase n=1 Tax=Glaciecola petra TaxID=3075602 RepID=A0ABU2ZNJ1_9ALTE|nr:isoaspartyl peptidase/L-asparaginase [Aestuariibacter sp. P117]MDT0594196.1 isoaspartyl peptidase/L-asparaginase [Aestuariibacter sp. P117]